MLPVPRAKVASTMPNSVTDDWAEAVPAAARTARAINDFFMQVSPRLNIGLRCEGVTKCRHFCAPAGSPGQPPFGKLSLLHQSGLSFAKYLAFPRRFRCTRTTEAISPVEPTQHCLLLFRMAKMRLADARHRRAGGKRFPNVN